MKDQRPYFVDGQLVTAAEMQALPAYTDAVAAWQLVAAGVRGWVRGPAEKHVNTRDSVTLGSDNGRLILRLHRFKAVTPSGAIVAVSGRPLDLPLRPPPGRRARPLAVYVVRTGEVRAAGGDGDGATPAEAVLEARVGAGGPDAVRVARLASGSRPALRRGFVPPAATLSGCERVERLARRALGRLGRVVEAVRRAVPRLLGHGNGRDENAAAVELARLLVAGWRAFRAAVGRRTRPGDFFRGAAHFLGDAAADFALLPRRGAACEPLRAALAALRRRRGPGARFLALRKAAEALAALVRPLGAAAPADRRGLAVRTLTVTPVGEVWLAVRAELSAPLGAELRRRGSPALCVRLHCDGPAAGAEVRAHPSINPAELSRRGELTPVSTESKDDAHEFQFHLRPTHEERRANVLTFYVPRHSRPRLDRPGAVEILPAPRGAPAAAPDGGRQGV